MIAINSFIEKNVTFRNESMFQKDIDANSDRLRNEIDVVFYAFTAAFAAEATSKSDIVAIMKKFLVNFDHVEKGKNLDSKM